MSGVAPVAAPLKVLHVAQTALGGVGSYLEEIIPLQIKRYGTASVMAVLPGEHVGGFAGLRGPWLRTFDGGRGGRLQSSLRMTRGALAAVRQGRPDIVHLHSSFAGMLLRPVLWTMRDRPSIVYCPHGWAFDRKGGAGQLLVARTLERALARCCDAIVCVSQSDFHSACAAGIDPLRMRTILNGIADQEATGAANAGPSWWPGSARRILFVGRLDRQKGVDVLFAAMRRLGDRAFAVVVGSSVNGDDDAVCNAPANVRLTGWLPRAQIADLYRQAEVLAMPSRWEGLPLAAMEAMRAGLPVVAARVGGVPELVVDGACGCLVAPDSPEELALALAGLDTSTLAAMGANARLRYERLFRVERVEFELDAVYRGLTPAQAAPPLPGDANEAA